MTKPIRAWLSAESRIQGPLSGVRVLELAGMGPAPFAAMMMADMGASVLRVDRPQPGPARQDVLLRNRVGTIHLDLKSPEGRDEALKLAVEGDVLIEGFRPGVMERLGLGPEVLCEQCPRLIYGRVTGWGQEGPLASTAGHDINYLAITGALEAIRRPGERPVPPLNLVGDYGGGGMFLLAGVLAAIIERGRSGTGTVVDASMVDGTALLMSSIWTARANGAWSDEPGTNKIDGGAPFYDVYRTLDDKFMAVGCIEPHFYAQLVRGLELDPAQLPDQNDQNQWPKLKAIIAARFAERPRAEWAKTFDGTDACVTAVVTLSEAHEHPQMQARATLRRRNSQTGHYIEPAPAPRLHKAVEMGESRGDNS